MKKLIPLLLVLILALSLFAGCGTYSGGETKAATDAPQTREKTKEGYGSITIAATEPNTLNLLTSQSNLDKDIFYLTSVMLYRPYGDQVNPEMVTNVERSEDGKKYTYTLREANYVDGTPVVAADFVYYLLNSTIAQSSSMTDSFINGKAYMNGECEASEVGCYAPDDHTLVVELAEDAADFNPEMYPVYPLKQSYAEEKGDALGGTAADFLCSGPYILTDWTFGASLTFKKNPDYWNAAESFQIAEVKLIHGTDSNAQYNMFTRGEADILWSINSDLQEKLPDVSTHKMTGALQGLEFNTTGMYFDGTTFQARDEKVTALLANKNFRMALCNALNREALVAAVDPSGEAANRYFEIGRSPSGGKFIDEYPINTAPKTGDEALAKEYLAKAMEELGYKDVSELPTVQYLTFENANFKLMGETIQSEWKRVLGLTNIELKLKPIQDAIMSMVYMDYDIYYQATGVTPDNLLMYMKYWKTGGPMSDVMQAGAPFSSIYSNADFDAVVTAASSEFDEAARNKLIAQAEEIFMNDYIFIPIMNQGNYTAVSSRVKGFVVANALEGIMLDQAYIAD